MLPSAAPTTVVERQGVFVTPQSLTSFAGASGITTLIWRTSGLLQEGWDKEPLVALLIAALVGAAIYLINETDPARGPVTGRERLIGIFIAIINTIVIFSAAVGAGEVIAPGANGDAALPYPA